MKWVGIIQEGTFWGEIFGRGGFPGVSLMGGNFPSGNFPRTVLPIGNLISEKTDVLFETD